MEQERKQLKTSSWIVLLFAGLTLVQIIAELLFGEMNSMGAPDNILLITKMVLLGFSVLFLLPKAYVGFKGLRIAKKPNASKGHIIWAGIIFVLSVLSLLDPAIAILKREGVAGNASAFFSILVEVVIYYDYIKHARAIAKLSE